MLEIFNELKNLYITICKLAAAIILLLTMMNIIK